MRNNNVVLSKLIAEIREQSHMIRQANLEIGFITTMRFYLRDICITSTYNVVISGGISH